MEGRPARLDLGPAPGRHPWRAGAFLLAAFLLAAPRALPYRRLCAGLFVAAALRLLYGPMYKMDRKVRML
jgi:hypothetical protein